MPIPAMQTLQASRRASSTPTSPVAGYFAWYDAADTATITATSNAVSQWNDKSANALHLTQGTGSARPTSGVSTLNGRNIVTFDGGDHIRAAAEVNWKFMHDGTKYTVFICANVTDAGAAFPALMGTTAAAVQGPGMDILAIRSSSTLRHSVSAGSDDNVTNNAQASAITLGQAFVMSLVADPGNATASARSSWRVNAGTSRANNAATATPSASNPARALTLGNRRYGDDAATLLTGSIAEVIIYNSELSAGDRAANEAYLKAKWGTP